MRILIEAVGSLTSGYLIHAIKNAGYIAVGSDISDFNHGKVLCDDFIVMPKADDSMLWIKTIKLLKAHKIDVVLPSFDETMLGWAERTDELEKDNIKVILSPYETIKVFQDKWQTYNFLKKIDVVTPKTSLNADYELIKPREGRGGRGIFENSFDREIDMTGMISQEKITGIEYTVDTLFDQNGIPVYIVPRKRMDVKDGKSTKGVVIKNSEINKLILHVAQHIKFVGPVNFQLFETPSKELILIEINPRVAGGMALGFAATENWISLIIKNIVCGEKIIAKEVNFGLKMVRYYDECYI